MKDTPAGLDEGELIAALGAGQRTMIRRNHKSNGDISP